MYTDVYGRRRGVKRSVYTLPAHPLEPLVSETRNREKGGIRGRNTRQRVKLSVSSLMYAQIAHNQGKNSTPHIEYTQVYRQRVLHIAQIKVILADKVICVMKVCILLAEQLSHSCDPQVEDNASHSKRRR